MDTWELELQELLRLALTDIPAAGVGVRKMFEDARSSSDNRRVLALGQALQVLLDTKEWYEHIAPVMRAHTTTGLALMAMGSAEETLGLFEAAFDSYARSLVAEQLAGDRERLEIAIDGLKRVFLKYER